MNTTLVYQQVIKTVNYFLSHTNGMQLSQLQELDPDVGTMAKILRQLVAVLQALVNTQSYDDENMAINALQCCVEMEKLAAKILAGDATEIDEIFSRLEKITNAPTQL